MTWVVPQLGEANTMLLTGLQVFFFVVWGLLGRKLLYHCGLKDILLRRSLLCYTAHSILTHNESEDILRGCSSYLKGLLKPSHDCSADGRLYLRTRRAAPPFCVYDRSGIHRSQSGPSYIFMFVLREQWPVRRPVRVFRSWFWKPTLP